MMYNIVLSFFTRTSWQERMFVEKEKKEVSMMTASGQRQRQELPGKEASLFKQVLVSFIYIPSLYSLSLFVSFSLSLSLSLCFSLSLSLSLSLYVLSLSLSLSISLSRYAFSFPLYTYCNEIMPSSYQSYQNLSANVIQYTECRTNAIIKSNLRNSTKTSNTRRG
jgi:ABC-type transport system involved in multi-copper enzyme maturation permease subunit